MIEQQETDCASAHRNERRIMPVTPVFGFECCDWTTRRGIAPAEIVYIGVEMSGDETQG